MSRCHPGTAGPPRRFNRRLSSKRRAQGEGSERTVTLPRYTLSRRGGFPHGAIDDYRRYVQSGNRVTGAGISSGLDVALYIVSLLYGVGVAREGQLSMQYNPQPAFHCGDPDDTDIRDNPGMIEDIRERWQVDEAYGTVAKWLGK